MVADHGRTKQGKVLWFLHHEDGTEKVLPTYRVIRLARALGSPKPWMRGKQATTN